MFSVVIPLYNKAHTITSTIRSVLNQTFQEFEIIVVNDGSTDDGVEVVKNFTTDSRIKIVNQENGGVSSARNKGVANASNNHIAFLDGDDEWMPGFLEKMKEAIELFPDAAFYGTSSLHRNVKTGRSSDSTLLRYKDKIQLVNYFENPGVMPHTSAVVASKGLFNTINAGEGFPVGMKCCEDWSCFYRLAMVGNVVYVGFPLGIRNNNVEGQITASSKEDRFKLLKHVVDFYNLVFQFWKSNNKRPDYIEFLKYDLRCRFLVALKDNDYRSLNFLLSGLGTDIKNIFPSFELKLYPKTSFKKMMIGYIYATKVIWRRHGYPIVGKNK